MGTGPEVQRIRDEDDEGEPESPRRNAHGKAVEVQSGEETDPSAEEREEEEGGERCEH